MRPRPGLFSPIREDTLMTKFLAIYLLALAGITLLVMLAQQLSGKHGLLTVRNFGLIGFIVFQLTGAFQPLWTQSHSRYFLDWPKVGLEYSEMATLFLIVFFLAYEWWIGAKRLAKWTPTSAAVPGPITLLWLAGIFTILAVLLRLAVNVPYVSMIAGRAGIGFAAVAVGMTAWVWVRSVWNPVYFVWFGVICAANFGLILSQSFGRRNLIALGASIIWAMYYSSLRYMNPRKLLVRLTIITLPPLLLVAAFTSVRSSEEGRVSLTQQLVNITTQSNLKDGLLALASGQDCAPVGMWTIENFPERFKYNHLLAIKYFFYLPIPRAIWEDKPLPLGKRQPALAGLKGVDVDKLTTGPGVIGHAAAEGGFYALVVYAFVGALFLRYFDEIVSRNSANPLVVLPVGSALGQIVGLPRGDLSLFAAAYVVAVFGVYFSTISLAKLLGMIRGPEAEPGPEYENEYENEYWDEEYGEYRAVDAAEQAG